ncbi:MAG: dihydroneopterin aldolase [Bacillota bacterium]|nr:dihydroneopterin aldolase [Bacillota bacterium]
MSPALSDQVIMSGMVFFSHVGVLPEEKKNGQNFILDVIFHCDRLPATATDLLAQTIDYGQAYLVIKEIVEQASYDLIERLAGAVADTLLQTYQIAEAVDVTVRKPEAPIEGQFDYMAVRIYRQRNR